MGMSQHGDAVGTNLVSNISIGSDTVRTHKDGLDTSTTHEMASHVIGNQGYRDAFLLKFPGGETSSLQNRARLINENMKILSSPVAYIHTTQALTQPFAT